MPGSAAQDRDANIIKRTETPRKSTRKSHPGYIVKGQDIVSIKYGSDAAEVEEQRTTLSLEEERQYELFPKISARMSDNLYAQLCCNIMMQNIFRRNKTELAGPPVNQLSADFNGETVNACYIPAQKSGINIYHL